MTTQQYGIITTDIYYGSYDYGQSVTLQADGKILVAGTSSGNFALMRYNSNGSLDRTFDTDGKVMTRVGSYGTGASVIVQADGKILVAGDNYDDFTLVRYNSNGSLDKTFDKDGKVTTNLITDDYGISATLQADGKILVAGLSIDDAGKSKFALARYNSNGSLDTTFDSDGKVTTAIGSDDGGYSVALQSDGKIVVAGWSEGDFALIRYNSDGSLDTTFDTDGKVTTNLGSDEHGRSVTLQADGKILVAGGNGNDFALVRYNTDGSLDTTFGTDGKITTDMGSDGDGAFSVTLQTDGKILVAGGSGVNFALARYNSDGSLDVTFDADGKVITDVGSSGGGANHSVTVQSDGKILVAGATDLSTSDIALVRYNSDGSLDTTFNGEIKGTARADLLNGDSQNNIINGLAGSDKLNGLAGNDRLNGGIGQDVLNGGEGKDILTGGTGKDSFVFNTALKTTGIDTITDFKPIDDTIILENSIFKALTTVGVLNAANFVKGAGAVALDANDFVVYDTTSGALFYDADGSGTGAAVQIALIGTTTHAALTNADFVVI